jgi:hypothetical protein
VPVGVTWMRPTNASLVVVGLLRMPATSIDPSDWTTRDVAVGSAELLPLAEEPTAIVASPSVPNEVFGVPLALSSSITK